MPDDVAALEGQQYSFDFTWKAPLGRVFAGRFTHRAPTVDDTLAIAAAYAKRLAKADGDLGRDGNALAFNLSHLEVTLVERPDWARDLGALPHPELLNAVAQEVSPHIERFCLGGERPPPG